MLASATLANTLTQWLPQGAETMFYFSVIMAILLGAISLVMVGVGIAYSRTERARLTLLLFLLTLLLSLAIIPLYGDTMGAEMSAVPTWFAVPAHAPLYQLFHDLVALVYAVTGFVVLQALGALWVRFGGANDNSRVTASVSLIVLLAAFAMWIAQNPPQWLQVYASFVVIAAGSDLFIELLSMVIPNFGLIPPIPLFRASVRARDLFSLLICALALSVAWMIWGLPLSLNTFGMMTRQDNPLLYELMLACATISAILAIAALVRFVRDRPSKEIADVHNTANSDLVLKVFCVEIPLVYFMWLSLTTPPTVWPFSSGDLEIGGFSVTTTAAVVFHGLASLFCATALLCVWLGEWRKREGLKTLLALVTLPVTPFWDWLRQPPAHDNQDRNVLRRAFRKSGTISWRWWLPVYLWIDRGPGDDYGLGFLASAGGASSLLLGSVGMALAWEYMGWPMAFTVLAEITLAASEYALVRYATEKSSAGDYLWCFLGMVAASALMAALTLILIGHEIAAIPGVWGLSINLLLIYTLVALIDTLWGTTLHLLVDAHNQNFIGDPLRWILTLAISALLVLVISTGVLAATTENTGLNGTTCAEAGIAAMVYLFFTPLVELASYIKRHFFNQEEARIIKIQEDIDNIRAGVDTTNKLLRELIQLMRLLVAGRADPDHVVDQTSTSRTSQPEAETAQAGVHEALLDGGSKQAKQAKSLRSPVGIFVGVCFFACLLTFHWVVIVLHFNYLGNNANLIVSSLVGVAVALIAVVTDKITHAERINLILFFIILIFFAISLPVIGNSAGALSVQTGSIWPAVLSSREFYRSGLRLLIQEGLFMMAGGLLGYLTTIVLSGVVENYKQVSTKTTKSADPD